MSLEQRWVLYKEQCAFCKAPLTKDTERTNSVVWTQLVPTSRGGSEESDNLVPACERCVKAKGSFTADEYEQMFINVVHPINLRERAAQFANTVRGQEYIYDHDKVVALIRETEVEVVAAALCILAQTIPQGTNNVGYLSK